MATIDPKEPHRMRWPGVLALAGALSLAGTGCERATDARDADPYEACDYASVGDPCGIGPTVCKSGLTGAADGYCTQSCEADTDCVQVPEHPPAVCEQLYERRQCALPCTGDDECPQGNLCATLERFDGQFVRLCQPE